MGLFEKLNIRRNLEYRGNAEITNIGESVCTYVCVDGGTRGKSQKLVGKSHETYFIFFQQIVKAFYKCTHCSPRGHSVLGNLNFF